MAVVCSRWVTLKVDLIARWAKELEMPFGLRGFEPIIILVVVLLLFGVGRIGKIAGELGSSIREFRKGVQGDKEETEKPEPEKPVEK